jgi:N4-gp56 family major capsid protein
MADTTVSSANEVEQWADSEFAEYVRGSALVGLMGTDENSVIQVKEELTKQSGDKITFSLVSRLTGSGVVDGATLSGNEEALGNYGHKVTVHQLRHGVVVGQYEQIKSKIDLLNAARGMLKLWNQEKLRDLFLERLLSPNTDGLTTYAASTVAQRNAWLVANNPSTANQRVLYGAAKANAVSGVHATALGLIDTTNDDLHQNIVRLAKRMAQVCDPHIRPVLTSGKDAGKERFVMLVGSLPFRDLEANFSTELQNAGVRGEDNNLFSSGDLKVGNVIVKEVPEMDRAYTTAGGCLLSGVGDTASDVEATFLCGAQALLLAWSKRMSVKTDEFDYQERRGVATEEIRGCEKSTYSSFQHGLVTTFVSSVAD